MFYDEFVEGNIQIVDASPEAFTEFLQIFYLDKVTLTGDNVAMVMDLANKYDVPQCMAACNKFLKDAIRPDNTPWVYEMAVRYCCKDLITHCKAKIQIDPKSLFDTPSFKKCGYNTLMYILSLNLNCDELTVFNACMDWAKNKCERENIVGNNENYKKELGNCFYLIRFPAMTNKEFCSVLENHTSFFDIDTLADICMHITLERPLKVAKQFNGENRQKVITLMRYHIDSDACVHTIHEQEIMKFSTNKLIILKGIVINEKIHALITVQLLGNMKILNNEDESVLDELFFISQVNSNYYNFLKPIVIHPQQEHKIQIRFGKNGFIPVQVQQYDETIKLNEDIEFKFRSSADETYDCVRLGIISGVRFEYVKY